MAVLADWVAISPALILGVFALLVLLAGTVSPGKTDRLVVVGLSTLGTVGAAAVSGAFLLAGPSLFDGAEGGAVALFGAQLVADPLYFFFGVVFSSVAALVVVASYDYMADRPHQATYYSLVMLAATGMSLMAAANGLAVAFIALELSSLPSYVLVAFLKDDRGSVEAGLKYFLVGALSSSVLVYGISLVYGVAGAMEFGALATTLTAGTDLGGVLGLGVVMVVGGFAFKTASVPFHFWAPEAYEGSPAPVSAFLSSASKAAGFALAFRVFVEAFPIEAVTAIGVDWVFAFQILAVVTMTLGNFAAATQEEVKRMLAYSSIGHAGYVLIGLAALAPGVPNPGFVLGASMMHLMVYGFMNTGAFLFVALIEHWGIGRTFEDYNGLATRAPMACLAMSVCLFSLAGVPVGGGFLTKIALFAGAVNAGLWWLAAVGVVNSALSLFYYSRVVKAMWFEDPNGEFGENVGTGPVGLYAAVVAAAVLTFLALPAFGVISVGAVDAAQTLLEGTVQTASVDP
jgi:NADH-quinone oxidoreductase subunit N